MSAPGWVDPNTLLYVADWLKQQGESAELQAEAALLRGDTAQWQSARGQSSILYLATRQLQRWAADDGRKPSLVDKLKARWDELDPEDSPGSGARP